MDPILTCILLSSNVYLTLSIFKQTFNSTWHYLNLIKWLMVIQWSVCMIIKAYIGIISHWISISDYRTNAQWKYCDSCWSNGAFLILWMLLGISFLYAAIIWWYDIVFSNSSAHHFTNIDIHIYNRFNTYRSIIYLVQRYISDFLYALLPEVSINLYLDHCT